MTTLNEKFKICQLTTFINKYNLECDKPINPSKDCGKTTYDTILSRKPIVLIFAFGRKYVNCDNILVEVDKGHLKALNNEQNT